MKTTTEYQLRRLLALMISALVLGPVATGQGRPSSRQNKTWKVRNAQLELSVEEGQLVSRSGDDLVDSIPLAAIREVHYAPQTNRPVAEALEQLHEAYEWENLEGPVREALSRDPRHVVSVPLLPVMATIQAMPLYAFLWVKTHDHFVEVVWEHDGQEDVRTYQLGRKAAESFLATLEKETGKGWVAYRPFEDRKGAGVISMTVRLPNGAAVGRTFFMHGTYRAVFVPRTQRTGTFYIFFGEGKRLGGVLAAANVEVAPISSDEPPQARFETNSFGEIYLAEIRVNSKSLRFRELPAR